jgi:hypothetical protein
MIQLDTFIGLGSYVQCFALWTRDCRECSKVKSKEKNIFAFYRILALLLILQVPAALIFTPTPTGIDLVT